MIHCIAIYLAVCARILKIYRQLAVYGLYMPEREKDTVSLPILANFSETKHDLACLLDW